MNYTAQEDYNEEGNIYYEEEEMAQRMPFREKTESRNAGRQEEEEEEIPRSYFRVEIRHYNRPYTEIVGSLRLIKMLLMFLSLLTYYRIPMN